MESLEDSNNCTSISDSFLMYERYMKSFNVRENFDPDSASASSNSRESSNGGTIDLSIIVPQHGIATDAVCDSQINNVDKCSDSRDKSLFLLASVTSSHTDRSDPADARVSDESCGAKPVFISSIMENSNNAVDSVPLYEVKNENVFKLPITELSFNGTLKHVQKLKPIVDPITALSTCLDYEICEDKGTDRLTEDNSNVQHQNKEHKDSDVDSNSKWNDQSFSSLEASFDSGVRSPDMFSDGEDIEVELEHKRLWTFLQDVESFDKRKVKRIQETLQGVLPPPSVTTLKLDVTDMLRKYYTHLPQFTSLEIFNTNDNSMTPTKKVSFIQIPEICDSIQEVSEIRSEDKASNCPFRLKRIESVNAEGDKSAEASGKTKSHENSSSIDKSFDSKLCSETDAKQSLWPDILKCRYYGVYYNLSCHRERYEALLQRYAERYIGAETDCSVSVHSGGAQSPSSASKRKALRLKMAQAKSPGRRLSHLARRRQAFCGAAGPPPPGPRLVLIDKKKLVNAGGRRTPGKRTPRKAGDAPRSAGSSRKRAMRRLQLDDARPASQPPLKRALFASPEAAAAPPAQPPPLRSRRSLFGSPERAPKRARDDDDADSRLPKMPKSLSFGGDAAFASLAPLPRRASEMLSPRNSAELNDLHKKKLLWAVAEALRAVGVGMASPGFRESAARLARLTRRLLGLAPHAARLAAPSLSTSETLLRLARRYAHAVVRGRSVDDCVLDERARLAAIQPKQ